MAAGDIIVINEDGGNSKKGNFFDGVDDYVLHDAHGVARVAANDQVGTYTAWIYADDITPSASKTFLSAGDNSSTNEFFQIFIATSGKLRVILKHGGATQFDIVQNTVSMSSRKWHHIAVVQDGTQPLLYIDGLVVAATNNTSTDLTFWYDELTLVDKFAIGVKVSNATFTEDWKGAIGQVKYFNIIMFAEDILNEFKGVSNSDSIRAAVIETARVFDITMEDDGIDDAGSGADNGTLTGNAHYGGHISDHSYTLEPHVSGHAAEFMNTVIDGKKFRTIIKRGD